MLGTNQNDNISLKTIPKKISSPIINEISSNVSNKSRKKSENISPHHNLQREIYKTFN